MKKVLLAVGLVLSGCGGGAGARAPNTVLQQQQPAIVASAVLAAEAAGAIPVLDRTTSLLGTDANGNGVRDDIDAYINSLPDTLAQKKALTQTAASFNSVMTVDLTNPAAVDAVSIKESNALGCLQVVYGDADWSQTKVMLKYVFNTKERFTAYMKYNQALSGKMLYVAPKGVGCAP